ncbi:integrase [Caballeronia udeis]|uniref:Integrase n=1 Tax=Caballeronia udeis TaxID=1232866 RepID=A0ABW8MR16_9BURK
MSDIRKRVGKKGSTYQVRYADPTSKTGYSYKTFSTAKEARAFREDGSKRGVGKSDWTITDAIDAWLKICQNEGRDGRPPVSDATYRYYSYIADIMKLYAWQKGLRELTKPDVVAFRSWLITERGRYLAAKTLTYFHAVLAEMASRGLVASNVASGVSVRQETRYSEPVEIPTHNEIKALLTAADELANSKNLQIANAWARYRPMLYLAVDSGMRPQEYIAIAGRNLLKSGIQVERAIDRSGELSVTKTPAARRFIELSPETLDMVVHYRDHLAPTNEHDLVFPTSSGHWQSLDNWRKRCFVAACEKAGLMDAENIDGESVMKPRYTPYALRHYFASVLIAEGTDIAKIKTLMGHTDISTTFDVYAHLIRQAEDGKSQRTGMISRLKN